MALGSLLAQAAGKRRVCVGYGLFEERGVVPAAEEDDVGVVQVECGGVAGHLLRGDGVLVAEPGVVGE